MRRRPVPLSLLPLVVCATLGAGCASDPGPDDDGLALSPAGAVGEFGPAPATPSGSLDEAVIADLDLVFGSLDTVLDLAAIDRLGDAGDPRIAWLLTDLLRFVQPDTGPADALLAAWETVTATSTAGGRSDWGTTTDHLIAWDTPAPPDYVDWKRRIFELVEPGWAPFFDDEDAAIDWRWVSWGGVLIDDRPLDQTNLGCPEGCIPALNDPALTSAADGDWYPDDRIVFGVILGDEAVAFPKNIMEVHEMVNMTIDGRRIGMPYCTLCGSAQAYLTDTIPDDIDLEDIDLGDAAAFELRTSGLLSRSNKVMYEFHTRSVFDTFTGAAVSGPLLDAGVVLEPITVQTSTWGAWKAAHPDTMIVAEDGGIGRTYREDPLRGRDDNGPIFPIGDVDPRLDVQTSVVGVVLEDGTSVAFPADAARAALAAGEAVTHAGISITTDGAGLTAFDADTGEELSAHQAFWFAWSQFHTGTELWAP